MLHPKLMRKAAKIHPSRGRWLPWKIVPVRSLNVLPHPLHLYLLSPGFLWYLPHGRTSLLPQRGHSNSFPLHLRSCMYSCTFSSSKSWSRYCIIIMFISSFGVVYYILSDKEIFFSLLMLHSPKIWASGFEDAQIYCDSWTGWGWDLHCPRAFAEGMPYLRSNVGGASGTVERSYPAVSGGWGRRTKRSA